MIPLQDTTLGPPTTRVLFVFKVMILPKKKPRRPEFAGGTNPTVRAGRQLIAFIWQPAKLMTPVFSQPAPAKSPQGIKNIRETKTVINFRSGDTFDLPEEG